MVERGYVEDGEEAGVRRTEREKGSRKREGSRQEEPGAKTVEGKEGGAGESAWTGRGLERRKGGQMGEEEVDAWGQNTRSDSEGQR